MPKAREAIHGLDAWADEIVKLRREKYPLVGTAEKKGIVDIMKSKGVTGVTRSRVELLLKRQGERKYLGANEWAKVLRCVDFYKKNKIKYSVLMNGVLVKESTLQKKRRDHRKAIQDLERLQTENIDLPDCMEIRLEPQSVNEAPAENTVARLDTVTIPSSNNHTIQNILLEVNTNRYIEAEEFMGAHAFISDAELQVPDDSTTQGLTNTENQLVLSPMGQQFTFPNTNSANDFSTDFLSHQISCVNNFQYPEIPGLRSVRWPPPSWETTNSFQSQVLDLEARPLFGSRDSNQASVLSTQPYVGRFDVGASTASSLRKSPVEHGTIEQVAKPFWSKRPLDLSLGYLLEIGNRVAQREAPFALCETSTLHSAKKSTLIPLIPSIYFPKPYPDSVAQLQNNHAEFFGLSVIEIVKQDPRLQKELMEFLCQAPKSVSRELAAILFEVAIQNCDDIGVSKLLSLNLVDLNRVESFSIIRRIDHAVERSTSLRSIKVTRELIHAGADLEMALDSSIGFRSSYEAPPNLELVLMLLDLGAKIEESTLQMTLSWEIDTLSDLVLSRILSTSHHIAFMRTDTDIVDCLSDDLARVWIKELVRSCRTNHCGECLKSGLKTVEGWIKSAIDKGLIDLVEFLIESVKPYTREIGFFLICGVRAGQNDIVQLLLQQGASVDYIFLEQEDDLYPNKSPKTALGEAIRTKNDLLISILESHEAFTYVAKTNSHLQAALYGAAEAGNVSQVRNILIISPCHDKEILGKALNIASGEGHEDISMLLMNAGAGFMTSNSKWHNPLYNAIKQRKWDLVQAIFDRCGSETIDNEYACIEEAVRWGERSIIKDLINLFGIPEPTGETSTLGVAIRKRDMSLFQFLLDLGFDVADSPAFIAALEDKAILRELLIKFHHSYPRGKQRFGFEILQRVTDLNDMDLLDILLASGLVLNHSRSASNLLSLITMANMHNKIHVIERLLDAGANPNDIVTRIEFLGSRTALHFAIASRQQDLVEFFIAAGVDIHQPARLGITRTPLQQACEAGSMEIVELFLANGANPNEPAALRGGATSLQLCVIQGYCGIAERLLKAGADVHAKAAQAYGRTTLQGAAEYGRFDMLQLLWNAAGPHGFGWSECSSAIQIAERRGHMACSELIQDLYTRSQTDVTLASNEFDLFSSLS